MLSTKYDNELKLWHGPDMPPLYNPQISVAQALFNAMTTFGPTIAQISDNNGVQMTFNDMKLKTIRAAQSLQERGYQPKQIFCIISRNHDSVAAITFASIALGCPINTLDTSFSKTEIIHMLKITKPVLIFCDVMCYGRVKECLAELGNNAQVFTLGGSEDGSEPVESLFRKTHNESEFLPVKVDGLNEAAVIICSSGTTGLSKGVCLSHAALLDGIYNFNVSNCSDVMLCFSSLYWITGFVTLIRGTLVGATRIITTETFSPELQLRLIEQYKVTFTLNATHQLVLMLKDDRLSKTDLSSIKDMVVGGSKISFHVKTDMRQYIPNGNIRVTYGMSETVSPVSIDGPTPNDKDTVGRLVNGSRIKIIDEHENRCDVNTDGEICIKMNYKFLGYYGNQQATDELFDTEGFIKTGDVGHFDDDGYLYVTGRKKELLKYCGFQISPSEIDAYLTESSDIKSACVVGIPDTMATDLPAAVIVRAKKSNISEQDVFELVAGHFADHCKLRGGVYFVDSLPTTASGKILRRQVKDLAVELYNARKS